MDVTHAPALARPSSSDPPTRNPKLWSLSQQLEATFLSEMLKAAGVGEVPEGFGGGAGEDHFSGFLVREYAESVVAGGGIGLSESIYRSLMKQKENPE